MLVSLESSMSPEILKQLGKGMWGGLRLGLARMPPDMLTQLGKGCGVTSG